MFKKRHTKPVKHKQNQAIVNANKNSKNNTNNKNRNNQANNIYNQIGSPPPKQHLKLSASDKESQNPYNQPNINMQMLSNMNQISTIDNQISSQPPKLEESDITTTTTYANTIIDKDSAFSLSLPGHLQLFDNSYKLLNNIAKGGKTKDFTIISIFKV